MLFTDAFLATFAVGNHAGIVIAYCEVAIAFGGLHSAKTLYSLYTGHIAAAYT